MEDFANEYKKQKKLFYSDIRCETINKLEKLNSRESLISKHIGNMENVLKEMRNELDDVKNRQSYYKHKQEGKFKTHQWVAVLEQEILCVNDDKQEVLKAIVDVSPKRVYYTQVDREDIPYEL